MSIEKYFAGLLLIIGFCLFLGAVTGTGEGAGVYLREASGQGSVLGERDLEQTYSQQKIAALTFDDGPHPVYTEILLDGLKERNVKATFFLIGKSAKQYPELVRRMAEEGHLVGNHTMNHVQLNHLTFDQALEEIRQCSQVIRDLTGQAPRHIRPPFGEWGDELEEKVNMTAVLWDVDPCDWKTQDADTVVKRVLRDVEDGDIILLHDVYSSSVEAALELIDIMKEDGYAFGTAEEILVD